MPSTPRPTAAAAKSVRQAIYAELVSAYPAPVATTDLIVTYGTCAKSRLQELMAEGWAVEPCTLDDGRPGYRLVSVTRGAKLVIYGGCILRLDSRDGMSSRTHGQARSTKAIPGDVLDEAEQAAVAAYKAVLVRRGHGNFLGSTQRVDHQVDAEEADTYTPGWTGDFIDDGEDE